jgi:hypothetical protein
MLQGKVGGFQLKAGAQDTHQQIQDMLASQGGARGNNEGKLKEEMAKLE